MIKYNPHLPAETPCTRQDLFFVSEGIQCGNCLALVQDHRNQFNEKDKESEKDSVQQA